jgi:Barstar (barnase inhibitor)
MTAPRSMERVAARSSRAESGDALTSRWGVPSPSAHRHGRVRVPDSGMSGRVEGYVSHVTSADAYLDTDSPWTHVVADASQVPPAGEGLTLTLRGSLMTDLEGVFREFVRALEFPEYFGWNWPAFAECLEDLSWLPARLYLLVVTDADQLLVDDALEVPTLYRHLESAGSRWANSFALGPEWGGGEVPFNVMLIGRPPAWTTED